jgi:regulator of RNase E activity RraA
VSGDTASGLGSLLAGFKKTSTAVISDNLERLPGALGLRPFHRSGAVMVGPALTIRVPAGDNLMIHEALNLVRPGDVIVIDGDGETSRALVGEIIVTIAQTRGAAGFVIDGAIRDSEAIAHIGLPCFARGVFHRGPFKNGPGAINGRIAVGGLVVGPGDIVVGDADGVVAFPQAGALDLLAAVQAQEAREAEILRSIRDGTYTGAYGTK